MQRILLFCGLILSSQLAQANKIWQLDFLVFERVDVDVYSEVMDTWVYKHHEWPEMLPLQAEYLAPADGIPLYVAEPAKAQGIRILQTANSTLQQAARKLTNSPSYEVLAQYSVRFKQKSQTPHLQIMGAQSLRLVARDTRDLSMSTMDYWLSAPDLDPPIDTYGLMGWAQLDHQIHPILQLDISLLKVLGGILPLQIDPDGRQEYFRDQMQQYRLTQERRMYPGKLAYFDHYKLGVLARLSEIDIQPAAATPE